MNIFSRYLLRNLFIGFAAAAALLVPLFTTFDFINELEDVSAGGYRWTQALLVVVMRLPRWLIDLGPFIALLGGIVGLGQLSKSQELTAMRTAGFSIFSIARVVLCSGLILTLASGILDEWIASPLQQRALQLKNATLAQADHTVNTSNALWARRDNEFVTVNALDERNQPIGIEIFHYKPNLSLDYYIYAEKATVQDNGIWTLHGVNKKNWANGKETVESKDSLQWQSIFTDTSLKELSMSSDSFSIKQLNHYIRYLQNTGQPSQEFKLALWQKLGRPILIIAMILLTVPFTFNNPRAPGLGSRLAIGVIIGLFTYISYKIIVNLGLLLSLNVQLTTLVPPILLLIIALVLVYRFDKQH